MSAAELIRELEERGVELWFEGDRLRFRAPKGALGAEDRTRLAADRSAVLAALRHRAAGQLTIHPLSYAQRSLWVLHLRAPGSAAYNVALSARLVGPLDETAMRHAMQALVDRHAALRTTFGVENGASVQRVAGAADAEIVIHDARELDAVELRAAVVADYRRPFDLEHGPVCRLSVHTCAADDHVILLTVHHIAADGWTLLLLLEEFGKLYGEGVDGRPTGLERPPMQYVEYADWQAQLLAGPEGERLGRFWSEQMAALPAPLQLPADRPRPSVQSFDGASLEFELDATLTDALLQLARRESTTPFVLLMAAFHALLHRLSGESDLIVGTPTFGRGKAEFLRVAGDFINSVPVRARVDPEAPFRDLIAQVRQAMMGALDAQEYPLPLLVQNLSVERDAGRSALFDTMFVLQRFDRFREYEALLAGSSRAEVVEVGGMRLRPYLLPQQEGQFDLSMALVEVDNRFAGAIKYSTDIFDAATIERWSRAYAQLLRSIVADPGVAVGSLRMLVDEERRSLLLPARSPNPAPSGGAGDTMHARFESQAATRPDAIALRFAGQSISYRELNERANRVAHALIAAGAGPGTVVGLCLDRTPDLVAGLLGILKAGAAYLPLDLAYPAERVQFILDDAHAPILVSHSSLRGQRPAFPGTVIEVDSDSLAGESEKNPPARAGADDLIYVIYTSGSTGRPKGTLLTHRAVRRLMDSTFPWFRFDETDRWTLFHSVAFDFSVWELWGALAYGGTLVVVSHRVSRAPDEFVALVRDEGVTVLNQTPSAFRQFIDAERASGPPARFALRHVVFGGEALELQSLRPWFDRHGDARPRLVNMYGITETCVHVTYRPIARADIEAGRGSVIGEPIPDLRLLLLEPSGEPAPVGVVGEVHVGGPGLAVGYLNQPELTAERFVPDPALPGERLYRSGDLARRTADGELEYVGRRDEQVKIRGFRIELGEIEAVLHREARVRQSVVTVHEPSAGVRQLVAYVVAPDLSELALRELLRAALPEYMVPSIFVFLPTLPLTNNGKIDRRALPAPVATPSGSENAVAPENARQAVLLAVWRDVLRRDDIGITDNFFDLGGHSLLVVELLARVRQVTGHPLSFAAVFEAPTVRQMSELLPPEVSVAQDSSLDDPVITRESAVALLERLRDQGVRLTIADGDVLTVDGPKGVVDDALRQRILAHRPALIAALHMAPGSSDRPGRTTAAPLPIVPRTGLLPVSHMQQRLWFLKQLDPANAAFNVPCAMRFHGALDVPLMQRCLADLVQRHEGLRTRFIAIAGEPRCVIEPSVALPVRHEDLSVHADAVVREKVLEQTLRRFATEPFDLAVAPLARALWVRLASDEVVLCLVLDHIVVDGLSIAVLTAELRELYTARYASGSASSASLPPLPAQYVDLMAWQEREFARGRLAEHTAFWTAQLTELPEMLSLGTDRPRPAVLSARGGRVRREMAPSLVGDVRRAAREAHATNFMVLLAAFMVVLQRHSGMLDIPVGTAVGNRLHPDAGGVVGFFANNIVLRGDLSGNPTVREYLARVREMCLASMAHQEMPFDRLVELLVKRRATDHSPLFQVQFVLQNFTAMDLSLPGAVGKGFALDTGTARYELSVDVFEDEDRLDVYFEYNADLFDEGTIERMTQQYETLLSDLVRRPDALVSELGVLSASDAAALRMWNDTAAPYPTNATVHGLFEAQVARVPQAIAVVYEHERVSYAELNMRANRIAHALRGLGVERGGLVGICLERTVDMVAAMLAVLKAGAAYVPLDPAFPPARIEYMMHDAALAAVVTQDSLLALTRPAPAVLSIDGHAALIATQRTDNPTPQNPSSDLAYVIYTSGSTGRPKGVMVEHRSVVNFLVSMQHEPGIGEHDRFVAVTTLSFDIAGLELHGPLTCGGTVVLAPRSTALDGPALAALIRRCDATILQATPATWRLLLESGWEGHRSPGSAAGGMKMLCGGEALPRDLAERLLALHGELWNLYGPTETTIWSTLSRVRDLARPIAIGRPIANTTVHVLDDNGRPTQVGVPGELTIAGVGLARGYLGNAELTAEKFATLDLPGQGPTRVYRTGDMARWRNDGQLEFAGRRDHQVKLRGFRIELGEIETVLAQTSGVSRAVCLVREDRPGDQRLVAYVVADAGFSGEAARTALRTRLPEYMVPNLFVRLPALPLTPNGKIDRAALPVPSVEELPTAAQTTPVLMSPVEERVAAGWCAVLGISRVGLHDNFFDVGGHSMLMAKLHALLSAEFPGSALALVELFQYATIHAQAARLSRVEGASASGPDAASNETLLRARARAEKLRQSF